MFNTHNESAVAGDGAVGEAIIGINLGEYGDLTPDGWNFYIVDLDNYTLQ